VKSLQKPLPIPVLATHLPKNKDAEEEKPANKEVVFLVINYFIFFLFLLFFYIFTVILAHLA
jgi:hypothetical protein